MPIHTGRTAPDRNGGLPASDRRSVSIRLVFILASTRSVTVASLHRVLSPSFSLGLLLLVLLPLSLRLVTLDASREAMRALLLHVQALIALLATLAAIHLLAWYASARKRQMRIPFLLIQIGVVAFASLVGTSLTQWSGPVHDGLTDRALEFMWLCAVQGLMSFLVVTMASEPSPTAENPGDVPGNAGATALDRTQTSPCPQSVPLYAEGMGQGVRITTSDGPVFRAMTFASYLATVSEQDGILLRRATWVFNAGFDRLDRNGADLFVITADGTRHQVGRTRRSAVLLWAKERLYRTQV